VLVARADHPFARRDAVTWAELEGHPLVRVSSQTANRTLIDDALGSRREAMVWRWEVDHLATAIRLVEVGAALAVVPRSAIPTGDAAGLRAVALRGPSLSRTLGIVTKRGAPLSDLGRDLADRLVAAYAEADGGRADPA
jgi:DNA-binding transcriptional LysR family regulator